jgi:hypothetical protein
LDAFDIHGSGVKSDGTTLVGGSGCRRLVDGAIAVSPVKVGVALPRIPFIDLWSLVFPWGLCYEAGLHVLMEIS